MSTDPEEPKGDPVESPEQIAERLIREWFLLHLESSFYAKLFERVYPRSAMVQLIAAELRARDEKIKFLEDSVGKAIEIVRQRDEKISDLRGVLGYGGPALIHRCMVCGMPYPAFSVSSHMRCWGCRAKDERDAPKAAEERLKDELTIQDDLAHGHGDRADRAEARVRELEAINQRRLNLLWEASVNIKDGPFLQKLTHFLVDLKGGEE